jgi:hypothetical protein
MNFFRLAPIVGAPTETSFTLLPPVDRAPAPTCPRCGAHVGMMPPLPPYRATLRVYGKRRGDIAFNGTSQLLVTENALSVWRSAGLRGFDTTEPVEIVRTIPRALTTPGSYRMLIPRHDGTEIDRERTVIERDGPVTCVYCGGRSPMTSIKQLVIDETSWSGADLFVPRGVNGQVVVTERLVTCSAKAGLENVSTAALDQYRWEPLRTR